MTLSDMSLSALRQALQQKQLSSREVTEAYLSVIEKQEPAVGAFVTVTAEKALETADSIDQRRAAGELLPPLAGIPVAVKDNICTRGIPTTCSSKMLEHFVPPYSAAVWERLSAEGMPLLGKTNMDEFAMGSTTETSYFHPTHNPRCLDRVPGGSSGGSAAAVAAGEAPLAIGSDTGGSIRQPAAFCGVVGLKPTYGSVSRYGLVAFASSLDQIGPMTRTVEDCAAAANILIAQDARDATSVPRRTADFTASLTKGVNGLRLALPREFLSEGLAPEIRQAILSAAKTFEGMGARIEEVSMPSLSAALPAYYLLSSAEASSNLARFDGVKYGFRAEGCETLEELYRKTRSEGFGKEVKRRIMLGTFALSSGYYDAYYKKASQVRTRIVQEYERIFRNFDAILSPVAPTVAWRLQEKTDDPLQMYLGDIYTVPVNIAGLPALALPCGKDGEGLPIGMQLIGPAFSEELLFCLGNAFEQSRKGDAQA